MMLDGPSSVVRPTVYTPPDPPARGGRRGGAAAVANPARRQHV